MLQRFAVTGQHVLFRRWITPTYGLQRLLSPICYVCIVYDNILHVVCLDPPVSAGRAVNLVADEQVLEHFPPVLLQRQFIEPRPHERIAQVQHTNEADIPGSGSVP